MGLTLEAPWALTSLLALPALLWLHRRLAEPARTVVPSLLFFVEDATALLRAERRRRDLDLLLLLAAAAALGLAATGPRGDPPAPGRHVRVVVAGGAPAAQAGYDARVAAALRPLREALGPRDRIEVVAWPGDGSTPVRVGPRPAPETLAALAEAGAPGLAVVVSDASPAAPPPGVRWIAVGDAGTENRAILSAALEPADGGPRLLVTVLNHARRAARVRVVAREGGPSGAERLRRELLLGPDAVGAVLDRLSPALPAPEVLDLRLEPGEPGDPGEPAPADGSGADALALDDAVRLSSRPFLWSGLDAPADAALRAAVSAALVAALGPDGVRRDEASGPVDLHVVRGSGPAPSAGACLRVAAADAGPATQALVGDLLRVLPHPLTADLDAGGLSLPSAPLPFERGLVLIRASEAEGGAPVLSLTGSSLLLEADPLAGAPALVEAPFWPLLLENLVRWVGGARGAGPTRVEGLLDAASSRLGRVGSVLSPGEAAGVLAGVAPASPSAPPGAGGAGAMPAAATGRPWLACAGVLLLLAFWVRLARLPRGDALGAPGPGPQRGEVGG